MVKIYWDELFIDDYGLMINMETNLGLITLLTNFPRCNKYITLRLICALEIKPGINIEHLETPKPHFRDIQTFIHRLLMKVEEGVLYPRDMVTRKVIDEYRRKYGRA